MSPSSPPGRLKDATLVSPGSPFVHIARIDVRELSVSGDRFLSLIVPDLASETALGRYIRELLAVGRWREICIQPTRDEPHECFDVYGVAAEPGPLPH
jgi:hypothetical protein